MLGSINRQTTTSPHSAAASAAASRADIHDKPVHSALTSRAAVSFEDSPYDAGQAEIAFFEALKAAHASPSEHMPEFYPRLTADLTKATADILANNPAHANKITALKAEIDSTNADAKLDLPHVLYFHFKIAALCSQLEEKDGVEPLSIPYDFNAPFKNTFFQTYACSDDTDLGRFTYDEYVAQYPANSQKDLLTDINNALWPIPFFGEQAEFGMATYNDLLSKGLFPIGFPTQNKEPDGEKVHPLGFAIHDFSHFALMHTHQTVSIDRKLELMQKFANIILDLTQQKDLSSDDVKTIHLISFIITHEVSGGDYITGFFDHQDNIRTPSTLRSLMDPLVFRFIDQEIEMIAPFIDVFTDAGYVANSEDRERDQLMQQFTAALSKFMTLLFPEGDKK